MWFKGNNIEGEEVVTREVPKEVVTEENMLKKVVPEEVVPEDIIENKAHVNDDNKCSEVYVNDSDSLKLFEGFCQAYPIP